MSIIAPRQILRLLKRFLTPSLARRRTVSLSKEILRDIGECEGRADRGEQRADRDVWKLVEAPPRFL